MYMYVCSIYMRQSMYNIYEAEYVQYICMYVFIYVFMYVFIYVFMYVYEAEYVQYICMYVFIYVFMYVHNACQHLNIFWGDQERIR